MLYGLRQETIPPNGVEHAVSLALTPSAIRPAPTPTSRSRVISNLVVARASLLRIFEVREERAPLPSVASQARRKGRVSEKQAADGFVSIGEVQVNIVRVCAG